MHNKFSTNRDSSCIQLLETLALFIIYLLIPFIFIIVVGDDNDFDVRDVLKKGLGLEETVILQEN